MNTKRAMSLKFRHVYVPKCGYFTKRQRQSSLIENVTWTKLETSLFGKKQSTKLITIYLKEAILNGTEGSCNFLEKLFIEDYFPYQHLQ